MTTRIAHRGFLYLEPSNPSFKPKGLPNHSRSGSITDSSLEAIRPALYGSARAILRRPEDIEDAVQEALLRLLKGRDRFDERRGSLLVLGRTTVRRVAIDILRKRIPELGATEPVASQTRTHPLDLEQIQGHLTEAVDALPDPQRTAFLLVFQEGLTHEQAADLIGISNESLRSRLYRARCQLRIRLKGIKP